MSPRRILRLAAAALATAALAACGGAREPATVSAVDDFGDTLRLAAPATRIVSLNPVTTELVFALGAGDRLVGRTSWDLYPAAAAQVTDLGAGMGPNVEAVIGQRPDLVLLYASEMNRAAVQQLRRAGIATLTYRTDHVADLARVTPVIAGALDAAATGRVVVDSVAASLDAVRAMPPATHRLRAFWHVWDEPILTIGRGSYLHELLVLAGGENSFGDLEQPSPQVSLEEIVKRDPDVILAGPSGADAIRRHKGWQAIRAVREGRIVIIDTTIVGRPGVRMGEAARHLRALLDSAAKR